MPLDWSKPDGETIGLALIRAEATDDDRIGSLLFNFGGPGGSGVSTLPAYAETAADLRERYDLVSWDPRGTGGSGGVRCRDDKAIEAAESSVDGTPDTPGGGAGLPRGRGRLWQRLPEGRREADGARLDDRHRP